ncbi:MAG TPA: four helix bundle protein [Haloferula sp.]
MGEDSKRSYDLEERLLSYGAQIITLTRLLSAGYAERHVSNQLLRAGTAPLSHHGEAQAAESPADFIHKLRLGLKELREAERWLKLIKHADLAPQNYNLSPLLDETDQLVRIFVSSIATAEKRRQK